MAAPRASQQRLTPRARQRERRARAHARPAARAVRSASEFDRRHVTQRGRASAKCVHAPPLCAGVEGIKWPLPPSHALLYACCTRYCGPIRSESRAAEATLAQLDAHAHVLLARERSVARPERHSCAKKQVCGAPPSTCCALHRKPPSLHWLTSSVLLAAAQTRSGACASSETARRGGGCARGCCCCGRGTSRSEAGCPQEAARSSRRGHKACNCFAGRSAGGPQEAGTNYHGRRWRGSSSRPAGARAPRWSQPKA